MNDKIINAQKHLANLRFALLLVTCIFYFSDLSAQNGGKGDTIKVKPIEQYVNEPEIFVVVEDMPEFPGGQAAMSKYRGKPVMVSYVLPIRFELGIAKPSEAPKEKK